VRIVASLSGCVPPLISIWFSSFCRLTNTKLQQATRQLAVASRHRFVGRSVFPAELLQ
jgi:hypothetical protein